MSYKVLHGITFGEWMESRQTLIYTNTKKDGGEGNFLKISKTFLLFSFHLIILSHKLSSFIFIV